eukprot:TRINITY_DN1917_c1_g1_i2.p1 TRINITY_DN1917_c1_g1~~TRINITY_DN1917_c1_g1_i2.p1  ORF type:complete len:259 (-),score=19.05 TRINITY_DN1917_c1_g1_i2:73-849(-)
MPSHPKSGHCSSPSNSTSQRTYETAGLFISQLLKSQHAMQVQLQSYRYTPQLPTRNYRKSATEAEGIFQTKVPQQSNRMNLGHRVPVPPLATNTTDCVIRENIVESTPWLSQEIESYLKLIVDSYHKETGQKLIEEQLNIGQQLWSADFGVLAHDISTTPYLFVYANQTALKVFGCSWDEIIGEASYKTADQSGQQERNKFTQEVMKNGYGVRYNIKRISLATGAEITIDHCIYFNVTDANGRIIGQAARLEGFNKSQ